MRQTIEIDVPEGWEIVGYRRPQHDEFYLKGGPLTTNNLAESILEALK